jgi:3,4-dihydroxy 2-butanone 4-phosphate synthase/GTP cyclohydrolase II
VARGEIVVVLDDEDRENEGDLIMAADHVTPEAMAFFVTHTSGVVCVGIAGACLDRLRIPLMVPAADNDEAMTTAFTVTVDLAEGTTTGISAADRAATIRALADPAAAPADFKRPGHIFPLRYRPVSAGTRGGALLACVHAYSPALP